MTCAIALRVGAIATAKADLDFYVEDRLAPYTLCLCLTIISGKARLQDDGNGQ